MRPSPQSCPSRSLPSLNARRLPAKFDEQGQRQVELGRHCCARKIRPGFMGPLILGVPTEPCVRKPRQPSCASLAGSHGHAGIGDNPTGISPSWRSSDWPAPSVFASQCVIDMGQRSWCNWRALWVGEVIADAKKSFTASDTFCARRNWLWSERYHCPAARFCGSWTRGFT
jgi:hypothetical protein